MIVSPNAGASVKCGAGNVEKIPDVVKLGPVVFWAMFNSLSNA